VREPALREGAWSVLDAKRILNRNGYRVPAARTWRADPRRPAAAEIRSLVAQVKDLVAILQGADPQD